MIDKGVLENYATEVNIITSVSWEIISKMLGKVMRIRYFRENFVDTLKIKSPQPRKKHPKCF